MDPFSIAVGVLAICGAAKGISKCASEFYTVARETKAIRKDVENFASHILSFGDIVHGVYHTLYHHCKESLVVRRLEGTLYDLAEQSEYLTTRLEGLQPRVKDRNAGPGFYLRYRWYKGGKKREENWIWMERIKSSFVMIMLQVVLEGLEKRLRFNPESAALREQIKDQKRSMRRQRRSMRIWTGRCENEKDFGWNDRDYRMLDILSEVEDLVLSEVANIIPKRKSSRSLDSRYVGNRLYHFPSAAFKNPSHETLHPQSLQLLSTQRIHPGLRPNSERDDGDVERITTISNHTPRNMPYEDIQDENISEYMAVRATENHLRLDTEQVREALTGYINGSDSPTTAKLNDSFPENIISEHLAVQLGLQIENAEDEVMKDIEFVGGNDYRTEVVRGRVEFVWKDSSLRKRKVTCRVCEYCPFPLIFGSSFIQRKEYYLRDNSMSDVGLSSNHQ